MERTAPVRRPPSRALPRQPAGILFTLVFCFFFWSHLFPEVAEAA